MPHLQVLHYTSLIPLGTHYLTHLLNSSCPSLPQPQRVSSIDPITTPHLHQTNTGGSDADDGLTKSGLVRKTPKTLDTKHHQQQRLRSLQLHFLSGLLFFGGRFYSTNAPLTPPSY